MDLFEPASFRANHPPKRLLTPSLETSQCSPCSALIDLPQWKSLDTNQLYISVRSFSPISPYRLLHLNELLKSEKVHNLRNFILKFYHTYTVRQKFMVRDMQNRLKGRKTHCPQLSPLTPKKPCSMLHSKTLCHRAKSSGQFTPTASRNFLQAEFLL